MFEFTLVSDGWS